ncbi:lasso peptide biosynthesis PqqD family chaperone [Fictibacillus halophilus]|uniref:lasso peptide biosynthesis PqqD family chaperone n=1 Tax=Fictibacillus halophilus TaxID=1610490 RepID=UPI00362548CC
MQKVLTISKQSVIQQKQENIISDMDGETVMMSIQNGKYYNLGVIGGTIWNKLIDPISFEHLIDDLISEFEIEKNECESQVISFLELLYEENLVVLL